MTATSKSITRFLMIIILIGFFLRIYHLSFESLWLDEGGSIRVAGHSPAEIIRATAVNFHPPCYYLFLHGWIQLWGESEYSIRLLSVLAGVISIIIIYRIGVLLFDKNSGVLAAYILALAQFQIYYDREARMYSLLGLLALLSMYYFIRLFRERRFSVAVGYLLSSLLLVYTQNMGWLIIITQNLFFPITLFSNRRPHVFTLKKWLKLEVILLICYLPWIRTFIGQLRVMDGSTWFVARPTATALGDTFLQFSGSIPLMVIFIALLMPAILVLRKLKGEMNWKNPSQSIDEFCWSFSFRDIETISFLAAWLIIPVILTYFYSRYFNSVYLNKALISAAFPLYLLVGRGISSLSRGYLKIGLIVLIGIFSLAGISNLYTHTYKDQWRSAVNYISNRAEPGDLIVVDPFSCLVNVFNYYSERSCLPGKRIEEIGVDNLAEFEAVKRESFRRIWVVLAHEGIWHKDIDWIRGALGDDYYLSRHRKYENYRNAPFTEHRVGLEVYLFNKILSWTGKDRGEREKFAAFLRKTQHLNQAKDYGFEEKGNQWDLNNAWLNEDVIHTGRYSLHLQSSKVPQQNFFILRQRISLNSDSDYIFGAFIKTRNLKGGVGVEIKEITEEVSHPYQLTAVISGDNDWTPVIGIYRPWSDSGKGNIEIEFRPGRISDFREGEFWIDDVFIIPYSSFPVFQPTVAPPVRTE